MTRTLIIFCTAWFAALGSGALEYAHNVQHAREDATPALLGRDDGASHSHRQVPSPRGHDDATCAIHAQLHSPLLSPPSVVQVICIGLLVAFVTRVSTPLISVRIPARIDCRGPPVIA